MAHQQRLVDKLQLYVRVQDNLSQREAAPSSTAVVNGNNNNNTNKKGGVHDDDDDDEVQRQQDALSARLDVLLNSLKTMTAASVQVC